jgi:RNA polymerase sigma factor (sigma-70 family)
VKNQPDEKALLKGLAASDKIAVEAIYAENYNMVQALIVNNNGSADDAKDIFQETMIVLFEKVRTGGLELNCQIKTFIFSIARRLWLKRLQQQKRFLPSDNGIKDIISVEDDLMLHEQRNIDFEMLDKAINTIGEPCKSILEAYYFQKQNMQVIAANFGYTNSDNAKNQKYKCLMRLKKLFFANHNSLKNVE